MAPLALASVLGLTVVFERSLFWARLSGPRVHARTVKLAARLRAQDFAGVTKATAERRDPYARLARELSQENEGPIGEARAREAIETQRYAVERFQGTLSILITAAPMLGILGTVTGIITSFAAIGEADGDLELAQFAGADVSPVPSPEGAQAHGSDAHAFELAHWASDAGQHAAHLAVAPFGQRDLQMGAVSKLLEHGDVHALGAFGPAGLALSSMGQHDTALQ